MVQLHFIGPGKPTRKAQIESLNGKIRDEPLNAHSFITIFEARRDAAEWRQDYNEVRPHFAIERQGSFAEQLKTNQLSQLSAA
ncbi:MAG: transposase [Candidatus Cybelea sp.]